jgi:hypothetical protein
MSYTRNTEQTLYLSLQMQHKIFASALHHLFDSCREEIIAKCLPLPVHLDIHLIFAPEVCTRPDCYTGTAPGLCCGTSCMGAGSVVKNYFSVNKSESIPSKLFL